MTFDEQLRSAFDTLSTRLREDVEGHARAVMEGLITTAEAERADAVAQAARDAWAAAERESAGRYEAGIADARATAERETADRYEATLGEMKAATERESASRYEAALADVQAAAEREHANHYDAGLAAGVAHGKTQAFGEFKESSDAASDRMVTAIRAMDRATSLSETLDVLVNAAGAEAPRAGLFLVESAGFRSWRLVGFPTPDESDGPMILSIPDGGIVADAAATGDVVKAGAGSPFHAPPFCELPPDRVAVAVPMEMSGQVFAVLYADEDNGGVGAHHAWPSSVELLTRYASRCLELQTATRLVHAGQRT